MGVSAFAQFWSRHWRHMSKHRYGNIAHSILMASLIFLSCDGGGRGVALGILTGQVYVLPCRVYEKPLIS
jgi:hypothetical protein